jgi:hypothetical protein
MFGKTRNCFVEKLGSWSGSGELGSRVVCLGIRVEV